MSRKVFQDHGAPDTKHQEDFSRVSGHGEQRGVDGYADYSPSIFVDIWGGKQGNVFVADQDGATSTAYPDMSLPDEQINTAIGIRSTRYWVNEDKTLSISWEVGQRFVFVKGVQYDLSAALSSPIIAAMIDSTEVVTVLYKSGQDLMLGALTLGASQFDSTQTIMATPHAYLYVAFLLSSIVVVTSSDDSTTVLEVSETNQGYAQRVVKQYSTLKAGFVKDINRKLPIPSTLTSPPSTSTTILQTVKSLHDVSSTDLTVTGEFIVACSSYQDTLGLLVAEVTCHQLGEINHPAWGYTESVYVQAHPLMALGFVVGHAYDYTINYTSYDTGQQSEATTRDSSVSFYREKLVITGSSIERLDNVLPSGSYYRYDMNYTRQTSPGYNTSGVDMPFVPDITGIWATRPIYHESGNVRDRRFTQAVKVYAADPINDVYIYQSFEGTSHQQFMAYDEVKYQAPDPLFLAGVGSNYQGQVSTIVRAGGKDTVLAFREYVEEVGVGFSERYDLNYEPTTAYYTPPPEPDTFLFGDYHNEIDNQPINRSMNIAFVGKYLSSDADKALGFLDFTTVTNEQVSFSGMGDLYATDYVEPDWTLVPDWTYFKRTGGFNFVGTDHSFDYSLGDSVIAIHQTPLKQLVSVREVL